MNRILRNLTPHLRAEYARHFPSRPTPSTKEFQDEILVLGTFLMRQIDPTGRKPIIEPPAYAEGADPQPSVRTKVRPGGGTE